MKRIELSTVLPLRTPFSLHVFPSYYCNFRCVYCLHSLTNKQLKERGFKKQYIPIIAYMKAIDSLKEFPDKLKTIIFAGHGEPLLHKSIAKMVDYAKKADVTERTEIVTNGSMLNFDMSDSLINAGLDLLRVSVQGVTDEAYERVSGTKFKVSNLIKNLTYFYEHRKDTRIQIKIINIGGDSELFYKLFKPICDEATVEYLIPFIKEIDHTELTDDLSHCKHGNTQTSRICSMPFHMLALEPNGNIVSCCNSEVPLVYGKIIDKSLKQVWDGKKAKSFLRMQLTDLTKNKVCKECSVPRYGLQEGDYLDNDRERLLEVYNV